MEAAGLVYEPVHFCIDSLPMEEEDWQSTLKMREAILLHIDRFHGAGP